MNLRELYQQHYFHEADRKDKINNSTAIPLGIISIISGGLVVVASDLEYPFNILEKFQIPFILLAALSAFSAIYYLARCYRGYKYHYIPTMEDIKSYHDNLIAYYISQNTQESNISAIAEAETLEYIDGEYANCTSKNTINNDLKQARLFKANGLIVASVISLALASAPYVYKQATEADTVQKIEIANIKELNMSLQDNSLQKNNSAPPLEKQAKPEEMKKPTPPASRVSLEHLEPSKNK